MLLVCFRKNKTSKKKCGQIVYNGFACSLTFYSTLRHYDNNKVNLKILIKILYIAYM